MLLVIILRFGYDVKKCIANTRSYYAACHDSKMCPGNRAGLPGSLPFQTRESLPDHNIAISAEQSNTSLLAEECALLDIPAGLILLHRTNHQGLNRLRETLFSMPSCGLYVSGKLVQPASQPWQQLRPVAR